MGWWYVKGHVPGGGGKPVTIPPPPGICKFGLKRIGALREVRLYGRKLPRKRPRRGLVTGGLRPLPAYRDLVIPLTVPPTRWPPFNEGARKLQGGKERKSLGGKLWFGENSPRHPLCPFLKVGKSPRPSPKNSH